jgi:hypothetical protein
MIDRSSLITPRKAMNTLKTEKAERLRYVCIVNKCQQPAVTDDSSDNGSGVINPQPLEIPVVFPQLQPESQQEFEKSRS